MFGYCGLGNEQLSRCFGKAQSFGNRIKNLQPEIRHGAKDSKLACLAKTYHNWCRQIAVLVDEYSLPLSMTEQDDPRLIKITDLNFSLVYGLKHESMQEGYAFIERTIDDWNSGDNKFAAPGEGLWGLVSGTELIGIAGLNRDPYTQMPNIGRVRHLYIRSQHRRNGYATALMLKIMNEARQHFNQLRLFTDILMRQFFMKNSAFYEWMILK